MVFWAHDRLRRVELGGSGNVIVQRLIGRGRPIGGSCNCRHVPVLVCADDVVVLVVLARFVLFRAHSWLKLRLSTSS